MHGSGGCRANTGDADEAPLRPGKLTGAPSNSYDPGFSPHQSLLQSPSPVNGVQILMRSLTIAASIVFALNGGVVDAQVGTNFSGTWVMEQRTPATAPLPERLVVEQPLTTTAMRGTPMPPAYLYINVERHFADRVQKDSYQIGIEGGTVGAVVGATIDPAAIIRDWLSVRWVDGELRMERDTLAASGDRTRRVERWRVDEGGRMVISISITQSIRNETQTAAYRREAK